MGDAMNQALAGLYAETLLKARSMECDSVVTYRQLLAMATTDADRAVLQEILNDEEDHFNKLSALLFDHVTQ